MKKKRYPKIQTVRLITESNFIKIGQEMNGQLFFEIGNETTTDVAEAVSILMRRENVDDSIWEKEIIIDYDCIEPRKCLYWLSGGHNEWINGTNYKKNWSNCDLDFQEEFGSLVISILKRSKTLSEIRDGFLKYLNLPILYEFAIQKDII